jgi:dipeptidyl aminopeptidase/acylaminoacyl peptidase
MRRFGLVEQRGYGGWASPVSAQRLTEGAAGIGDVRVSDGRLYWTESRPAEGGRLVVMTDAPGGVRTITPEGFNVRTRVHEYGGAPFAIARGAVWFANFADQRLYRQPLEGGGAPQAVTPAGYRYADISALGDGLVCVREDHADPARVKNAVVRLSGREGDGGELLYDHSDFVAFPSPSPDGRRLAWIAWDFPAMPWDSTRLYVADLAGQRLADVRQVAGGDGTSVVEPRWRDDGALFWVSDETGWWNLWTDAFGSARIVREEEAEYAGPLWTLGRSSHVLLEGGRILAAAARRGQDALLLIDPASGEAETVALPFDGYGQLRRVAPARVAAVAWSSTQAPALIEIDVESRGFRLVRRPSETGLEQRYISSPEPISFPSSGGRIAHALYYPPRNDDFAPPPGERPPLIVQAHGGPTAQASNIYTLGKQYWTSRGFALVDVDYGGSTGYGRAYRQLLAGAWGVVDVEDVIAAVRRLVETERVDPARVAIRGGSAGGFTVLAALASSDVFSAGTDAFGVADLGALARETHKFESRYLDGLVGPYPEAKAIYDARSPINHLDGFTAPLLILQGADDPIVPKNQSEMIYQALKANGVPVAMIVFDGEGHGFRRAETLIRAQEAELSFYGQVLGFEPAGDIPKLEVENLHPPP